MSNVPRLGRSIQHLPDVSQTADNASESTRIKLDPQTHRNISRALPKLDAHIALLGTTKQKLPLRHYQFDALKSIRDFLEASLLGKSDRAHLVAAEGFGKTAIYASFLLGTKLSAIILVPGPDALDQAMRDLAENAPSLKTSAYYSKTKDLTAPVILATYHVLPQLVADLKTMNKGVDVVICDEAHRSLTDLRNGNIAELMKGRIKLGFTATPEYNDSYGVSHLFGNRIFFKSRVDAIHDGILSGIRCIVVTTDVDLSQVKTLGGDFERGPLARAVNVDARNRAALQLMQSAFPHETAVAFCVNRQHCFDVAEMFNAAGFRSAVILAETPLPERLAIKRALRAGELQIVVAVNVLNEAWDEKKVAVVFRLRPTQSPVVAGQQIGRAMRPDSGRTEPKIVVEFVDRGGNLQNSGRAISAVQVLGDAIVLPRGVTVGTSSDSLSNDSRKPSRTRADSGRDDLNASVDLPGMRLVTSQDEVLGILSDRPKPKPEDFVKPCYLPKPYEARSLMPVLATRIIDSLDEDRLDWNDALKGDALRPVREFLVSHYLDGNTSAVDLAAKFGAIGTQLRDLACLCGIPTRGIPAVDVPIDRHQLFEKLIQDGEALAGIADEAQLAPRLLKSHVLKQGIVPLKGRLAPSDLPWVAKELLKESSGRPWFRTCSSLDQQAADLSSAGGFLKLAKMEKLLATPEANELLTRLASGLAGPGPDAEDVVVDAKLHLLDADLLEHFNVRKGFVGYRFYVEIVQSYQDFLSTRPAMEVSSEPLVLLEQEKRRGEDALWRETADKERPLSASFENYIERTVTPRERDVLHSRNADGDSLQSIGEEIGITKERVRQIELRAEGKLRRSGPHFREAIFEVPTPARFLAFLEHNARAENLTGKQLLLEFVESTRDEQPLPLAKDSAELVDLLPNWMRQATAFTVSELKSICDLNSNPRVTQIINSATYQSASPQHKLMMVWRGLEMKTPSQLLPFFSLARTFNEQIANSWSLPYQEVGVAHAMDAPEVQQALRIARQSEAYVWLGNNAEFGWRLLLLYQTVRAVDPERFNFVSSGSELTNSDFYFSLPWHLQRENAPDYVFLNFASLHSPKMPPILKEYLEDLRAKQGVS